MLSEMCLEAATARVRTNAPSNGCKAPRDKNRMAIHQYAEGWCYQAMQKRKEKKQRPHYRPSFQLSVNVYIFYRASGHDNRSGAYEKTVPKLNKQPILRMEA